MTRWWWFSSCNSSEPRDTAGNNNTSIRRDSSQNDFNGLTVNESSLVGYDDDDDGFKKVQPECNTNLAPLTSSAANRSSSNSNHNANSGSLASGAATSTARSNNGSSPEANGSNKYATHANATSVLSAAQALALCIQQSGNVTPAPDPITAGIISTWLEQHLPRQDTDDRLRRLNSDKETLTLQVQVLSEQVSAQSEKIGELERVLTEKEKLLNDADDLLRREMLSRSSLETQKLELISAMSELKLQQAALERENLDLRTNHLNNSHTNGNGSLMIRRPPLAPNRLPATTSSSVSTPSSAHNHPLGGSHGNLQQNSMTPKTPPSTYRRQIDLQYNSLPRQSFPTLVNTTNVNGNAITPSSINVGDESVSQQTTPSKQRNVAFAETEKIIEDNVDMHRSYTPQQSPSPSMSLKNRGFRSIFGKIKRSNSGNLEDLSGETDFRRGGLRATANARLGWSGAPTINKCDRPFDEWDIDAVCVWFDELGLGAYEDDARKWLKKGAVDLVKASPVDIEKELNLKNSLHRKKIVLALADVLNHDTDEIFKNASKLDTSWVMRWLDDIGLPQHKDAFAAARIDGRMLHKLTMDDLGHLHVTSCLHATSLRRAIQVMREYMFDDDCLIRRSGGEEAPGPYRVQLWTAHRVMEWLRLVDLAEYAPNLRGAGVHGALMMYEPKFNAELLADLLSIPPSKTLLRRHLATHFKELLGRDIIQAKRDTESVLGFQPLTLTAKLKTPKKSQFSLKRKKSSKGDTEWTDFVCPMGPSGDHLITSNNTNNTTNTTTSASNNNAPMTNQQITVLSPNQELGDVSQPSNNNSAEVNNKTALSTIDNKNNASPTSSTRSTNS